MSPVPERCSTPQHHIFTDDRCPTCSPELAADIPLLPADFDRSKPCPICGKWFESYTHEGGRYIYQHLGEARLTRNAAGHPRVVRDETTCGPTTQYPRVLP